MNIEHELDTAEMLGEFFADLLHRNKDERPVIWKAFYKMTKETLNRLDNNNITPKERTK